MKHRTDFRGRAAVAAALGVLGIVVPLGAVLPAAWSPAPSAQASPVENIPSDPSGDRQPNSLSRGDATPPSTEKAKPAPVYTNCEQVWAHGGGPIYVGQPGYSVLLDPEGTGVACSR
ncbi:excalibur calcium-binding domain-containing protein [Nocardia niigatensis]|uniref:excalibur calcium-binding domain-containing protein n=1 Tax=Nocardia niigatensis TaxID=209249 RepID=UPI000688EBA5|nr:excalibur calcium-binding domain-containing protein [Nocardia niigatensis]